MICMDNSDWIALAALIISVGTAGVAWWQRRVSQRRADVTAFLHWLPARAHILVDNKSVFVGYHLVLWNRGPNRATEVNVKVHFVDGHDEKQLALTDVAAGEFPLAQLEAGARYPIPWALGSDGLAFVEERRFVLTLSWTDSGDRSLRIPVRRGNSGAPVSQ
jgi:hypothetical protein